MTNTIIHDFSKASARLWTLLSMRLEETDNSDMQTVLMFDFRGRLKAPRGKLLFPARVMGK